MECDKNTDDNPKFTKIKEKIADKEETMKTIVYKPSQRPLFVIDTTGDSNLLKTKEEILKDTKEKFDNMYRKNK